MSAKTRNSAQDAEISGQKHVRKGVSDTPDSLDVERLKINLGHLVGSLSSGGKVAAYEEIASQLSALAGLDNGHSWSWRYVASVHSGSVGMSKKFMRTLQLLLEDHDARAKQWFYFLRRRSLAAVFEKSILREQVINHMKALGFRVVPFRAYAAARKRIRMRK